MIKNPHLLISAIIILPVGLMYGVDPNSILPRVFGFEVNDLELKNIFRANMGLYFAMGGYWMLGAFKKQHWRSATMTNVLFMGGLAAGRLVSLIVDGVSEQYLWGMLAEVGLMVWGIYNLKNEG
ncbi:MAG: DUF4345 domain-containing protein [Bacteroidota bacterium]